MNEYINLYMDNPTAGEQDGTAVSLEDAGNAPLTAILDASKNESRTIRCALRCQEGYRTEGETTLSFAGATQDHGVHRHGQHPLLGEGIRILRGKAWHGHQREARLQGSRPAGRLRRRDHEIR